MSEKANLRKNTQLMLGLFGLVALFAFQNCSSVNRDGDLIKEPQTYQSDSSGL